MRGAAKAEGLSQIGEISGAYDMHRLAAIMGIDAPIGTFLTQEDLWKVIVNSVDKGHAIVFPYTAANTQGTPGFHRSSDDFTHWCLLFGYAETKDNPRSVFMTTYGWYHQDSVADLFLSNSKIQDWNQQTWVKMYFWQTDPPAEKWRPSSAEWIPEEFLLDIVQSMADRKEHEQGYGFGTRDKLTYILGKPNMDTPKLNEDAVRAGIMKTFSLKKVAYSNTMCGKCVLVRKRL
jgi:hypothetical protein